MLDIKQSIIVNVYYYHKKISSDTKPWGVPHYNQREWEIIKDPEESLMYRDSLFDNAYFYTILIIDCRMPKVIYMPLLHFWNGYWTECHLYSFSYFAGDLSLHNV